MNRQRKLVHLKVLLAGVVAFWFLFAAGGSRAASKLSTGQARKIIARVGGSDLASGAIRVRRISLAGASASDVLAQVELAFNFVKSDDGGWRVAEVRVGDNRWEDVALIARAIGVGRSSSSSTAVSTAQAAQRPALAEQFESNLDARQARKSLARLLGIELPSDAVRVKEISLLGGSAIVVAEIEFEFRFIKEKEWRITEIRTKDNAWQDTGAIVSAINSAKRDRAQRELEMVAEALEAFRRERGFYIVAETEAALVDHLGPRYLPRVIRVDPWHQPYQYEGGRDRFTLRSAGADGKAKTSDDIVIQRMINGG